MRIRISDPDQLEDLRCALRDASVVSPQTELDTLVVLDPFSSNEDESRVEITFFVRAWLADRPNLDVDLAA
jgi:hypothetical protein